MAPVRAFDICNLVVSSADLFPSCASSGKPMIRELIPKLLSLIQPASISASEHARLIWALSVVSQGRGTLGNDDFIRNSLQRILHFLPDMHSKFAMMALKGLAHMVYTGPEPSDGGGLYHLQTAAAGPDGARRPCDVFSEALATKVEIFAAAAAAHLKGRLHQHWNEQDVEGLRIEGAAEAAAAAAVLCPPQAKATAVDLLLAVVRKVGGSGRVPPLRTSTRLLTAAMLLGKPAAAVVSSSDFKDLLSVAHSRMVHNEQPTVFQVWRRSYLVWKNVKTLCASFTKHPTAANYSGTYDELKCPTAARHSDAKETQRVLHPAQTLCVVRSTKLKALKPRFAKKHSRV
jgi:hypothetical protein